MAPLTTAARNALPASAFAGPNRSYPVNDQAHARNALSRAAQFAGPATQAAVKRKVTKKFPQVDNATRQKNLQVFGAKK